MNRQVWGLVMAWTIFVLTAIVLVVDYMYGIYEPTTPTSFLWMTAVVTAGSWVWCMIALAVLHWSRGLPQCKICGAIQSH